LAAYNRRPLDWGWALGAPLFLAGLAAGTTAVVFFVSGNEDTVASAMGLAPLALLLGGIGAAWLVVSYRANRTTIIRNRLARAHPDEPWRWRPEWDARRIVHSGRDRAIARSAAAIAVSAVCVPLGIAAVRYAIESGDALGWLGVPLLGAAAFMIHLAWRAIQMHRRFGETVLEIQSLPVRGELVGTVRTRARVHPAGGFTVQLRTLHIYVRGAGKRRQIVTDVLWETSLSVVASAAEAGGLRLDFTVPIPGGIAVTNDDHPGNEVQWRLRVIGDVEGHPFDAEFEVPVFG
jgi:hypothetical protein